MYYAACAPSKQTRRKTYRVPNYRSNSVAANVLRNDKGYTIKMAIPGFKKKEIAIDIEDHVISIQSKRTKNNEEVKFNRREFNYDSFKRSFTLGKNIDIDNIAAKMDNGILKIMLPLIPKEEAKNISIK